MENKKEYKKRYINNKYKVIDTANNFLTSESP